MYFARNQIRRIYLGCKSFHTTHTVIWSKCNFNTNAHSYNSIAACLKYQRKHISIITAQSAINKKQPYTYFRVYALTCFSVLLNVMKEYLFYVAFCHWHFQILSKYVLVAKHFEYRSMNHITDFSTKGVFCFYSSIYIIATNACLWMCKAMQGKFRGKKSKKSMQFALKGKQSLRWSRVWMQKNTI